MSWWRDFWKKPESASSHFAWGFIAAAIAERMGASDLLAVAIAFALGILWEVLGEVVCWIAYQFHWLQKSPAKAWHARAWDVTPFLLGGFALAFLWWLLPRGAL